MDPLSNCCDPPTHLNYPVGATSSPDVASAFSHSDLREKLTYGCGDKLSCTEVTGHCRRMRFAGSVGQEYRHVFVNIFHFHLHKRISTSS